MQLFCWSVLHDKCRRAGLFAPSSDRLPREAFAGTQLSLLRLLLGDEVDPRWRHGSMGACRRHGLSRVIASRFFSGNRQIESLTLVFCFRPGAPGEDERFRGPWNCLGAPAASLLPPQLPRGADKAVAGSRKAVRGTAFPSQAKRFSVLVPRAANPARANPLANHAQPNTSLPGE
jgi:hypothetical protein